MTSTTRFNPFPGLRPFRTDEIYLFFGREEQTAELLQRLRQTRFLAVVGTSGSGKSSLVQAGLLPELHGGMMLDAGSHWEMAVMRPGGNPMTNLAEALVAADLYDPDRENAVLEVRATLSRSGLGLVEAVRQSDLEEGTNILLVVDQFEEIFRFRRSGSARMEEAGAFVNLLLEASRNSEIPIYIALTMRSDYLGDCSEFPGLAEAVNDGEYLIPRLDREQKRSAISGPVKVGGGEIAPRLLQKLLNDVGDNPDHLPILQHALMRTWDAWEDDHAHEEPIDLRHYEAVGGMAEALSRHADEVFHELPDGKLRRIAEKVFKALTERSTDNRGIRRPAQLCKLCAIADADEESVRAVVDPFRHLGRTFLMPPEEKELSASTVIDISHESLMRVWTRLDGWAEEESQSARIYRRLVDTEALHRDGKAGLYHDPDLQIAQSWREEEAPNEAWADQYGGGFDEAMTFLDRSSGAARQKEEDREAARQHELEQAKALADAERLRAEEQQKGARRLRKLLAAAAVIAVIAVGASVFAVLQTQKAERSEAAAEELASQMKTDLVLGDFNNSFEKLQSGDTAASLAYLARAMRTDPNFRAAGIRALSSLTIGRLPVKRFAPIEHEEPIHPSFLHNEKHDLLLTTSESSRDVRLWEMDTGLQRPPLEGTAVDDTLGHDIGPAPPEIESQIRDGFAGAKRIWLASDPLRPPSDARFFRKRIEIPEGRTPVRADVFVEVDDQHELKVNETLGGKGNDWATTYHMEIGPTSLKEGLDISILAKNDRGEAGVVAAVFVTFEEGEPLVVTSDATWQSSTEPSNDFEDSKILGRRSDSGNRIEKIAGSFLSDFAWSADQNRLIAKSGGERKIVAWDIATGERVGNALEAGVITDFKVSSLDDFGDLVGCAYSDDGALQVWNLTTGEPVTPRLKTEGNVIRWQFSRDGRRIIGLFSDAVIAVWDSANGTEIMRQTTRPIRATEIAVSDDGRYVAAHDYSDKWVAWFAIEGSDEAGEANWVELPFAAKSRRFLASGNVIAFLGSGQNGTVRARSFALDGDRRPLADITSAPNATSMNYAQNSPGRSHGIVGAVTGNIVTLWDLRSGKRFPRPLMAPGLLASAHLTPDGRRLVAGSATQGANAVAGAADKNLFVFDVFTGRLAFPRPIVLQASAPIFFSPDAETMITSDQAANKVQFWDLRTGREVRAPVSAASVSNAIFSRSGKRVALYQYTSTSFGTTSMGQTAGRFFLHQIGLPPASPEYLTEQGQRWAFVFAPPEGGKWLTYDRPPGATKPRLQIWNARNSRMDRRLDLPVDADVGDIIEGVQWSADGKRMLFRNRNKNALLWDVESGTLLKEIRCEDPVRRIAISPDGSTIACGTDKGALTIWTEGREELMCRPFPGNDPFLRMGFNNDGSLLGVGNRSSSKLAVVLDARTGVAKLAPWPSVNFADHFVYPADGKSVILSQADYKVPMIDLASGETIREFEIADWSREIDMSRDGRVLAVGSGSRLQATSGYAYLFDIESSRMLTPPLPHSGTVISVRLSPDGKTLATATYPTPTGFAYFQLWDVATGLPLIDPVAERGQATSFAFQPDGSAVAVAWTSGIVQTVLIPPHEPAPAWLPKLTEVIAGRRLGTQSGSLENVPDAELTQMRERVLSPTSDLASDGSWFTWAKWLFEEPGSRTVSPGSKTTVARRIARMRAADNIDDLHVATRLAPTDALTFARLGIRYETSIPDDLNAILRPHWGDTAAWFSDHATALAPDNPEVWTLRAELMRVLNRPFSAAQASSKVIALSPKNENDTLSSNAHFQKALALAGEGKWDEAMKAFDAALGLLDEYQKQLEAGALPLPLLGNLARLIPTTRSNPTSTSQATNSPVAIAEEPIPGTYENFDRVTPGSLPKGWRVWNRSAPALHQNVRHASDFKTNSWNDWTVVDRRQLDWGSEAFRRRILREGSNAAPEIDDRRVSLLDGRFALAVSQGTNNDQIKYLESPDFDCSDRKSVHLAFHSAYEQHANLMGLVEFSLDHGVTWKPLVYFLHQAAVDEATDTDESGSPVLDLSRLLNEERARFPWWVDEEGKVHRGTYGAFTASADTPRLATRLEGRIPHQTKFKKREIIPIPDADDAAAVRVRFGSVSFNQLYWGIDNVGLYEGSKAADPVDTIADGNPEDGEIEWTRPANDVQELTKLAIENTFGREAAKSDPLNPTPLVSSAMSAVIALDEKPDDGTSSTRPVRSSIIESRLLIGRARGIDPTDRRARITAAAVEFSSLTHSRDQAEALATLNRSRAILMESNDLAADLGDSEWREFYSLIEGFRGMFIATKMDDHDGGIALLTLARTLVESNTGKAAIRSMLDSALGREVTAEDQASDLLLRRGSAWSYFDAGRLPAIDWMEPNYKDRLWFRGPARLGYSKDREDNEVTQVGYGPDSERKHITTYFRSRFELEDPDKISSIEIRLQRDDGAVIYLNGKEIVRDNMPASEISYETLALQVVGRDNEARFFTHRIEAPPLRPGWNVVAAEVHQQTPSSSDLGFDLEIAATIESEHPSDHPSNSIAILRRKFDEFDVPSPIQTKFWHVRTEKAARERRLGQAVESLEHLAAVGVGDTSPTRLRLEAIIAAESGEVDKADRLFGLAMDSALKQFASNEEPIEYGALPHTVHQASLLLRQTPADVGYLLRGIDAASVSDSELELMIAWIKARIGDDFNGLAELCFGLSENLSRHEEALALSEHAISSNPRPAPDAPKNEIRRYIELLQLRERCVRKLGEESKADALLAELKEPPPRNPALSTKLIDLSSYYNASLYEEAGWGNPNVTLSLLPESFVPLNGVSFDIRGIVQLESGIVLDGETFNERHPGNFPLEVTGIAVGQSSPAIHFLITCAYGMQEEKGTDVARLVIHYEDGGSEIMAVKYGIDVSDWHSGPDKHPIDSSKIGWRGRIRARGNIVLSELVWKNPHPEKPIKSIDFVSTEEKAAPFLLGITLE